MSPVTEISESQLAANRANAKLSTGPTSPEGKQRSRLNAGRHHLTGQVACLPDEDRDEFNRFCEAIVADYQAEGPIEIQLAQSIAEDSWRLNRGRAWETNMFALGHFNSTADRVDSGHPQLDDAIIQVFVFEKKSKHFSNIALYETRINRNIAKNEQRLKERQAERKAAEAQAIEELRLLEAEAASEAAASVESEPTLNVNGFVFSTPKIRALVARQIRLERAREHQFRLRKAA
jgi:hypothetical protein